MAKFNDLNIDDTVVDVFNGFKQMIETIGKQSDFSNGWQLDGYVRLDPSSNKFKIYRDGSWQDYYTISSSWSSLSGKPSMATNYTSSNKANTKMIATPNYVTKAIEAELSPVKAKLNNNFYSTMTTSTRIPDRSGSYWNNAHLILNKHNAIQYKEAEDNQFVYWKQRGSIIFAKTSNNRYTIPFLNSKRGFLVCCTLTGFGNDTWRQAIVSVDCPISQVSGVPVVGESREFLSSNNTKFYIFHYDITFATPK